MLQSSPKSSPCSNCSESIEVTAVEIERLVQYFVEIRNRTLVDEETATERLSICLSCDAYRNHGATCQHCGCLVGVKTRLSGERCPYPNNPKW